MKVSFTTVLKMMRKLLYSGISHENNYVKTISDLNVDSSLFENNINSWKKKNPSFNVKQDIANHIPISNITTCEIIHTLKKIKGKSPGIDCISLEFIKKVL